MYRAITNHISADSTFMYAPSLNIITNQSQNKTANCIKVRLT